jgi:DNA helicase HerA-like ATPase
MAQDFEKLGVFYLGREYSLAEKKLSDNMLLYDSRDLVTHAVVVGMTGSGKTGLCIGMIEEAAIDNVPSILIDPKGDLTNLLLTFPQLSKTDFLPWVNPDDASRKGMSVEDYANQQASSWQKGLADWGQDSERIKRLRDATEFVIYTPGSSAGMPVSILKSFSAPPPEILEDNELFQERINTTVTSLLGLLNIQADPLQSREHILISTIISQMWQQGQDIDLSTLITQIQNPPITKIGVLNLESFYPSKERFSLVMALNNLLASPGFSAWLEGVPLDISQILYNEKGKPRTAIFSIAHLDDSARMFFVSLLLNQILGWMRTQPGTTSLRALVYMDEIFGYFPPIANPPSKQPLLTLLKQARAFGVGIVLATQNPVDLDYKGLANTGTWFIGRLQTERDKSRVMEGLEGAAATSGQKFNRKEMEELLAGLGNRVFLMNNTHDDAPTLFQTRWCMSYLRGPLTRSQIKTLMDPYKEKHPEAAVAKAAASVTAVSTASTQKTSSSTAAQISKPVSSPSTPSTANTQPALPPDISQLFIPVRGASTNLVYQPTLVGAAKIRFTDAKTKVDESKTEIFLTPIVNQAVPIDWEAALKIDITLNDLEKSPVQGIQFGELPDVATKAKSYANWNRDFVTWLYGSQKMDLYHSSSADEYSKPGESERDFRVRLQQFVRERRDNTVEELRKKYASKINAMEEKIRKAQQVVDREKEQARKAQVQTALSVGGTLLSAFMGRKLTGGKTSSAIGGVGRSLEEQGDVNRAKETVAAYQKQLDELNEQLKSEIDALENKMDPTLEKLETITIRPKKTDISVQLVSLAWAPYKSNDQGQLEPAW